MEQKKNPRKKLSFWQDYDISEWQLLLYFPKRRKTSLIEQQSIIANKSTWDLKRIKKWKTNQSYKTKPRKRKHLITKKKLKTTKEELNILDLFWTQGNYPLEKDILQLADLLKWKRSRIVQWFTNKNKTRNII